MGCLAPRIFRLFLLLAAAWMLGFHLGRGDIIEAREAQRAAPALEMLRNGDYVVPTINGVPYLNKPPLIYWLIAASLAATGQVSSLAARLPTVCFAVVALLGVYGAARRRVGEMAGRWAALVLLTTPLFFFHARVAEIDIPLACCTFASIIGFYALCGEPDTGWKARPFLLMAGALGLACLLKFPVPYLFLWSAWLASAVTAEGVDGARRKWFRYLIICVIVIELISKTGVYLLHPAAGAACPPWRNHLAALFGFPSALILFLLLGSAWALWNDARLRGGRYALLALAASVCLLVPWAIAVAERYGVRECFNLLYEQAIRRTYDAPPINRESPVFYLLGIPRMMLPWGCLVVLQCLPGYWRLCNHFVRFSMACAGLAILFLSLTAGKNLEYALPALPFLAISAGWFLERLASGTAHGWMARYAKGCIFAVLGIAPLATFVAVMEVRRIPQAGTAIAEGWALFALATAVSVFAVFSKRWRTAGACAVTALFLVAIYQPQALHASGRNSPKAIAEATVEHIRQGCCVEALDMTSQEYPFGVFPAFAFYARTNIPFFADTEELEERLARPTPYCLLITQDALLRYLQRHPGLAYKRLFAPVTNRHVMIIGNRLCPEPAQ